MDPATKLTEPFDRAKRYFEESLPKHGEWVRKVENRYKAYRGVLDEIESDDWTSKLHPPYIMHIVETTLASLVEPRRRTRVRPRVTVEMLMEPGANQRARDGARSHQILHDWQSKKDRLRHLERPFSLQNGIAGLTGTKTYWRTEEQMRRRLKSVEQEVMLPNGLPLTDPMTGEPLTVPQLVEEEGMTIVYDGPTTEVIDVRDFGWHEAAISLEKSRFVWHRVWMDFEDIEEDLGSDSPTFGPDMGGAEKKEILDGLRESRDFKEEYATREQDLFQVDRTKDKVEVVELWDNVRREVTTFANRKVMLAHRPFPFWHGKTPFDVCSTQPDLFRIPGISQVEKIAHLQDMLWALQNQRIDNLQLINNAIFMLPLDAEEEEMPFEPGAQWYMDDPSRVQMWAPNVVPAEVSLGAEGFLKGDMQSLAGSFPFANGSESQTVDQKTATGASLVTSLAQRSINLYKEQLDLAWQDIGDKRMHLNQQFVREPTVVPVTGLDGEEYAELVEPAILTGDFDFEHEASSESMMEQQEQASATGLIQLLQIILPMHAALAQTGGATNLNLDEFTKELLKAFGKEDVDRFFSSAQAPQAAGIGGAGTPAGPGGQGGGGGGITAAESIDPATSPSADISVAPSVIMSRALAAANGGGTNI